MRHLIVLTACAALPMALASAPAPAEAAPSPPAFAYAPDHEALSTVSGTEREYRRLKRSVRRYCVAHTAEDIRKARTAYRCAGRVMTAVAEQMPAPLLALYEAEGGKAAALSIAMLDR